MFKQFVVILSAAVFFAACTNEKAPVTEEQRITAALQKSAEHKSDLTIIDEDILFWSNRLTAKTDDHIAKTKLASLYSKRFQYSGNINDVLKSDSLFTVANQLQKHFSSGIYRSLAANCVTQHRFQQADKYLDTALQMGDDKYLTALQRFDVKLELGQYKQAEQLLNSLPQKNNFDYYTRAAKLEDHKGNAAASIRFMEQAYADVTESKNEHLLLWVKTNLADMYGHNNRVAEAYKLYNEVLATDPAYYHAWKGIAWIAFSQDKNTRLAKNILYWLQAHHPIPDYDLMLSEIAAYENDHQEKNIRLALFIDQVTQPIYGDMYNKYLFAIMSDERNDAANALQIARKEILNRPTPQSYDLLAWSLYKNGQINEAARIANDRIINKTFEPDALYHIGVIYKQAGNKKMAKRYLNEALESSFELGPLVTNEIKEELKTL